MSGPYDSYGGHQYNQPQGNNPYPAQGYGQQQPPQHQGYPQQPYYPSQDGGYQDQGFAPPARTNSFGPPQHGGFQMGIQGQQYGAYDASNPQGNTGYYNTPGTQPGAQPSYDAFAQNQAYQQSMASGQHHQQQQPPYNPNAPQQEPQFSPQSSDPNAPNYDPNAPPMAEGERGLLGSIGGGIAGHVLGKKAGHGLLGTVGGGILGNLAEDFLKDSKKQHHHHHSHHSSHGSSSWGGSRY